MAKSSERKDEILKLIGFYDELISLLNNCNHQIILDFCDSWKKSREKIIRVIDGDRSFGTLSQNAAGLKQGMRDMPDIAVYLPISERRNFLIEYSRLVTKSFPDFFIKDENKINAIIKRGKIRNENEFYIAELFFDRLHEANPDGEDSVTLRRIMDDFEFGMR